VTGDNESGRFPPVGCREPRENPTVLRIVVANPKGGCGKSTLAASLAAFFAQNARSVALLDCDPQRSAVRWGTRRRGDLPRVHAMPFSHPAHGLKSAWLLQLPPRTECVIVDTPAAIQGHELSPLLRSAQVLLVPVMPSAMDFAATEAFVDLLARTREVRESKLRVGLVANRMRRGSRAARELDEALLRLAFPCVGRIRDSQHYVNLIGEGRALDDEADLFEELRSDWLPLWRWLLPSLAAPVRGFDGTGAATLPAPSFA
jgi:chromosome partitioning protein